LAAPSQLAHAGIPERRSTAAEAPFDNSSNSDAEEHQRPSASVTPAHIDATPSMPSQSEHCVILMRGVVWRSEEVEVMKLWQNLLRFWPVTFADSLVQPQGALQAHGGGVLTSLHAKHPCLQDYTQDIRKVDTCCIA
jgi:hypothetical protein